MLLIIIRLGLLVVDYFVLPFSGWRNRPKLSYSKRKGRRKKKKLMLQSCNLIRTREMQVYVCATKNVYHQLVMTVLKDDFSCCQLQNLHAAIKVIYPKYSKYLLSTVAHTIDCVCSKILNHGLNHGLLFPSFKFFGRKKDSKLS